MKKFTKEEYKLMLEYAEKQDATALQGLLIKHLDEEDIKRFYISYEPYIVVTPEEQPELKELLTRSSSKKENRYITLCGTGPASKEEEEEVKQLLKEFKKSINYKYNTEGEIIKMIIKTKAFQEAADKILFAAELDKNAANLEVAAKNNSLYLNATNKEYYVSVRFALESAEEFRAVVNASQFLNLISGITTDTFELNIKDNTTVVTSGKSNYKLAMIYENDKLMELPVIKIDNKSVEMTISNDILMSILNVNSKELLKIKNLKANVNELQSLYYIDESGCFTFTTGACLNAFTLEKPIKLLLNERIVKLFRLFTDDVAFTFGHDVRTDGSIISKIAFETTNVYAAAKVTNDELLISKVQGPCTATKRFINENYANNLVLSASVVASAIARLMSFTKNGVENVNTSEIAADVTFTPDEMIITDNKQNTEVVTIENESHIEEPYTMRINLFDLKLILDSCKNDHITLNCGNHRSVVINRGTISNLIPELKRA